MEQLERQRPGALITTKQIKDGPETTQNKRYSKSPEEHHLGDNSTNRYSEVLFKDNVFDSKDESMSGINELNLLQELTNFTNMKMLKNKKSKQKQQHCIHFDRIIKN